MSGDHTSKGASLAASASASADNKAKDELRSQEEVRQRYIKVLIEGRNIHRKSQTAYLRPAVKGEKVITSINGIKETENTVKDDHSWIACGKQNGEQYVLTNKNFCECYEAESAKPIITFEEGKEEESEHSLFLKRLKRDGFQEYESKRSVYAHEVSETDISWFNNGKMFAVGGAEGKEGIQIHHVAHFMAPWGEASRVEVGDLLVTTYPAGGSDGDDDEVYRIEKNVFVHTYKPRQVLDA